MKVMRRRLACPQTVQHIWDSVEYIRQQKQIPNFHRISSYMRRKYNLTSSDLEQQLNLAVQDKLVVIKKSIGCKGSKVGVEQYGYKLPYSPVERDGHDWYCFECHCSGEVLLCSACHRVFHIVCIKEDVTDNFVCCVCRALKSKREMKVKKHELNILLSYTCLRLKEKTRELHKMAHTEDKQWRQDHLIYKKMDILNMEGKAKTQQYRCLEEFQLDAQNVVHNTVIYFGVHSVMADIARQMLQDCIYDLGEIRQCQDCYLMSNEKNPPHKLVWARQKGFPYWPAKVIKQENNMYDVRFFGGYHQRANVESENIRPISTSLQKLSVKRTASLNKALKELKHHQGLVKKYHQTYTRTTSSRCGTAPCSRAKLRKYSDTSSVGYKTNELPGESPEVREEFEKEGPPCLSQKTARIQVLQVAASPDDHNVVSSSSQEFLSAKVSVCTQTPKKLLTGLLSKGGSTEKQDSMLAGDNCKCNAKYSKLFKEFKERFEKEHKVEKEEAVKKLVKKS
ncbi:zinc finger MYND domain-containing protein 11-like [Tachypleus tridentatus]|uniref:zinc finger MYND domain-containing protein 11-like n=1 Tax=Tachypleus tridentatus TaxID=6853 RepID=UPI003FCF2FB3